METTQTVATTTNEQEIHHYLNPSPGIIAYFNTVLERVSDV
jgi:hypothetical protein